MEIAVFLKMLLVVIALVVLAFLGLAVGIFLKKDGKFPELHISKNKNMKKKGITCANSTEKRERQEYKAVKIEKRRENTNQ